MMITVELIMQICAIIAAVGAAVVWIGKLIARALQPITDMQARLNKHAEFLESDQDRLEKIEAELEGNSDSTKLILKSIVTMLAHLETGNSTNQMAKMRKDIENYLINR